MTEPAVEVETDRLACRPRPGTLISCDNLDGERRDPRILRFALRSLSMLLESPSDVLLAPSLRRGIRFEFALNLGGAVAGLLDLDIGSVGADSEASDPGCDSQSSLRESSHACPIADEVRELPKLLLPMEAHREEQE